MRSLSYPFATSTKWRSIPAVDLKSLSQTQDSIIIRLPKATYENIGGKKVEDNYVDASFFIGNTLTGTPTHVVYSLARDYTTGKVFKYIEGDNTWLLSREVCILNNKVAFISIPTSPMSYIVGTVLMEATSRMAKLFKEKIIPDIVNYNTGNNAAVKIMNTNCLIVENRHTLTKPVTEDGVKEVLLENIDEMFKWI